MRKLLRLLILLKMSLQVLHLEMANRAGGRRVRSILKNSSWPRQRYAKDLLLFTWKSQRNLHTVAKIQASMALRLNPNWQGHKVPIKDMNQINMKAYVYLGGRVKINFNMSSRFISEDDYLLKIKLDFFKTWA